MCDEQLGGQVFESLEVWVLSFEGWFAERGITTTYSQSAPDRPNRSCSLNLRSDDWEADLVIWESGEGELILAGPDIDPALQEHLEELTEPKVLARTLARMVGFIGLP
jgi:hypothetical protein